MHMKYEGFFLMNVYCGESIEQNSIRFDRGRVIYLFVVFLFMLLFEIGQAGLELTL
jgi:hypothetical protein